MTGPLAGCYITVVLKIHAVSASLRPIAVPVPGKLGAPQRLAVSCESQLIRLQMRLKAYQNIYKVAFGNVHVLDIVAGVFLPVLYRI